MYERVVIAGSGQAAVQAIDTLRRKGFAGELVLIGDEPWLPYQRPPLSKKYLAGALERERLLLRPQHFYESHAVEARLGRRVEEIARGEQRLRLDDGSSIAYDALLIATGSRPRPLAAPGADLEGVYFLRTISDVERIRAELAPGKRLVIVGGGYIGLEVAATAREVGLEVSVLEMADRVMNRVVCPQLSTFYQAEHARHGVRILCNSRVRALAAAPGTRRVRAVMTEDGEEHAADVVVVGCGVLPADELAVAAGLVCENGVVVDDRCRTSDPVIYAAGDCTSHPSARYGRRLRLESVDNAFEQGASAALNLLGVDTVHDKVPWFWSDQYDLKLIIIGMSQGYDTVVVRGDPAARAFSACYLRGGELIAIDTINNPKDQMAARKLIAAHARPDPERLVNHTIPLKETV
ncbi:MAG TPA: FAD-dependent oxidoreductase [Steroidobacteraceae bacterium]|jgi:3-phenylpropionate/trans-cinnamate dioxygenase ferredoxin reductase subunit|nr:FAD-dependent oxidoreductase [Steroidobacteraceae bacterium]